MPMDCSVVMQGSFILWNLPQWLVQQTLRTVSVVFSTLLQLRLYIHSDQSYRSNRSDLKLQYSLDFIITSVNTLAMYVRPQT